MSDFASFQYIRRQPDEWDELRDRELEDFLYSRIQPRLTSLVTSTTRPTTNLFRGQRIYETDTGNELTYYGSTTGWQPAWNCAWGQLGQAAVTTSQGSITTVVDLTSLSVTFTALANRRYRISAAVWAGGTAGVAANDEFNLLITDGAGTQIQAATNNAHTATGLIQLTASLSFTTSAGSKTYKLRAQRGSGTGTWQMFASGTIPAFILAEDIGPTGNAPAS